MDYLDKKLPFSLEAEQSVLGSILIDPKCIDDIAQIISGEDFYLDAHRQIYGAMLEMSIASKDIDVVTLIQKMTELGIYDEDGSKNYIRVIAETVPTAANAKDYANIVRDKSTLRRLITTCSEIMDSAYSEQNEVGDVVENAEAKIFAIAEKNIRGDFLHIRDVLPMTYERLHALNTNKEEALGVSTGYEGLDRVLIGMGKTDLILVGARPAMGKTSFAINVATNVAIKTKKAVCIFSLEMSAEQIVSRILSSDARIESSALRSGELNENDWIALAQSASRLSETEIYIDDSSALTVTAMRAKLRRMKNLGLVVVDYLGLMQTERKIENRALEVGDITRNLKLLAKEIGVPILVCAQLSRANEKRTDFRPMLSDLRDSGSIEQDADVVMFLHREGYYQNKASRASGGGVIVEDNIAEVIIAKNRHGEAKTVKLGWAPQYTRFQTLDTTHGEGF